MMVDNEANKTTPPIVPFINVTGSGAFILAAIRGHHSLYNRYKTSTDQNIR
ncbi:hypothetical protein DSUL_20368 [Desulfovibrionales bacterium]